MPRTTHRTGFALVALAYAATTTAGSVPTPLYVLFQHRDHFGTAMVSVVFAVYVIGVIAGLLVAAAHADRLGRRPALTAAIAVQLLACAVFVAWPALPGLLLGRVLSGLSVGLISGPATTYLLELHRHARPDADRGHAEVVSTAANLGGIALGPLLSGVLAEWAPAPLRLPFLATGAVLVAGVLLLGLAPETATATDRPSRAPAPAPEHRRTFAASYLGALVAFAIFGLFAALSPSFLADTLGYHSHALAGVVACVGLGAAAGGQLGLRRLPPRRALATAAITMPFGLALVVAGVSTSSLGLFVLGGALAGAAAGLLLRASLTTVVQLSPVNQRARTLAALFITGYSGLAIPVIGLGAATQLAGPDGALTGFATLIVAALAAITAVRLRHDPRPYTMAM
ncbi:MFS transporter [Catellatospora paridis]|uniref:MFS transporter n=1 Tax=Catellatospora paridis TaxID=1617086 RepID=UPI0012D38A9E|nr:MFS transporter [Catellatospora paridis]